MTAELSQPRDLPELPEALGYLEAYTRRSDGLTISQELAESGTAPKKHHHGLVIGRFQPPHVGHLRLFKNALLLSDTITIGIGSANKDNDDNPYSADLRRLLLERALRREGIWDRIQNIVPLDDYGNGPVWVEEALKRTGPIDAVVGGNEYVMGEFEKAGYAVERVERYGEGYSATDIRNELRREGRLRRG